MHHPDKILIIRFSSIGDIILTSPVIRLLRENYPVARIDFLVKKEFAELVQWEGGLSNVVTLASSGTGELKELRDRIRSERYDLIVDLHNSLRSRYLRLFSGAGKIRVVRKYPFRRFLLVRFNWNFYRKAVPVVERYLDTVRNYARRGDEDAAARIGRIEDGAGRGVGQRSSGSRTPAEMEYPPLSPGAVFHPAASGLPFMHLHADTVTTAEGIVYSGRLGRNDRLLGIAPCAHHFTKRWPMDRFVRLAVELSSEIGVKFLIFGGPGDAEYCGDIAQLINSDAGTHCAESFAGRLSLLETAAAMDRCELVISNDTGLMHMAAARGRRVVAVFGSSVREMGFFPAGPGHVVLENDNLTCRPCSHIGRKSCPKEHFKCMVDITAGSVRAAVTGVLNAERNGR